MKFLYEQFDKPLHVRLLSHTFDGVIDVVDLAPAVVPNKVDGGVEVRRLQVDREGGVGSVPPDDRCRL